MPEQSQGQAQESALPVGDGAEPLMRRGGQCQSAGKDLRAAHKAELVQLEGCLCFLLLTFLVFSGFVFVF